MQGCWLPKVRRSAAKAGWLAEPLARPSCIVLVLDPHAHAWGYPARAPIPRFAFTFKTAIFRVCDVTEINTV